MKQTSQTIVINEQFHIFMKSYGWELHIYDKAQPKKNNGKIVPKKTHHPTIKHLCDWVINRYAGQAEDFETLMVALNRAAKSLESEFTIIVEQKVD